MQPSKKRKQLKVMLLSDSVFSLILKKIQKISARTTHTTNSQI